MNCKLKAMDIQTTKIVLAQKLLNETRESVLEKIGELLATSDEIVAHTVSGQPLTKADYDRRLEKSEEDIKAGRVLTHEELKERVKSWG